MPKLLTVIIPVFNSGHTLDRAVDSVLQQTAINDINIMIVDDGSTDQTTQPIVHKQLDKHKCIRTLTYRSNRKPSYARNLGIYYSNTPYILPLDSDDYFLPQCAEKGLEAITNNKGDVIHWKHLSFGDRIEEWGFAVTLDNMKKSNAGVINSSMYKKEDWIKAGGYNESLLVGYEDWEFYLHLMLMGCRFHFINEVLIRYNIHADSRNFDAMGRHKEIVQYIQRLHNINL